MKKNFTLLLALTLVLALSVPALAANETRGETNITTTINETYTVTIPEDVVIVFDTPSTTIGLIGLSAAQLGPGRQVTFTANVTAAGAGELIHSNGTNKLAYTLKFNDAGTNTISFSTANTTEMKVDITAAAWAAAKAGNYSGTITFSVACGDIT